MTPAKKRVMKMVWRLVAVAVAAEKQMKMNMGRRTQMRRPYISEMGLRGREVSKVTRWHERMKVRTPI